MLAPLIAARIKELNGGESSGGDCPGDGDAEAGIAPCAMWQATCGPDVSWEARVQQMAMCTACGGRGPKKEGEIIPIDGDAELMVASIERLVNKRDSGFDISPETLSPLEFELLMVWDSTVKEYERVNQFLIKESLLALVGITKGRK